MKVTRYKRWNPFSGFHYPVISCQITFFFLGRINRWWSYTFCFGIAFIWVYAFDTSMVKLINHVLLGVSKYKWRSYFFLLNKWMLYLYITQFVNRLQNIDDIRNGRRTKVPVFDLETGARSGFKELEVSEDCGVVS